MLLVGGGVSQGRSSRPSPVQIERRRRVAVESPTMSTDAPLRRGSADWVTFVKLLLWSTGPLGVQELRQVLWTQPRHSSGQSALGRSCHCRSTHSPIPARMSLLIGSMRRWRAHALGDRTKATGERVPQVEGWPVRCRLGVPRACGTPPALA